MTAAVVLILVAALLLVAGLLAQRRRAANRWAASLKYYELGMPYGLKPAEVSAWLGQLAAITRPGRLGTVRLVGLEVEATTTGITHRLFVAEADAPMVLAALRASLPGVRVDEVSEPFAGKFGTSPGVTFGLELRTSQWTAPLAEDRVEAAASGLLAQLQPLSIGTTVRVQVLLAGTRPVSGRTIGIFGTLGVLLGMTPDSPERAKAIERKQRTPLLMASWRLAIAGSNGRTSRRLARQLATSLHVLSTTEGRLTTRRVSGNRVARQVAARIPSAAPVWPVVANAAEFAGLIGWPLGERALPGLELGMSRRVPPSPRHRRTGLVLGESTYPGPPQPLTLSPDDRLRHTLLLGPTGVGKSHLNAAMILQDLQAGHGLVVIDPKGGDLIDEVLARAPENRLDDLVEIDATNLARPVGFNPLGGARTEQQRELAAETTVDIVRSIFSSNWGPRTDDLMRAAAFSLASVPAPDGSAFTLLEMSELLTNPALQRYVTGHPALPPRWRRYWTEYRSLSEADRQARIAAPLNKLRAIGGRTGLALTLGQSDGVNLMDIFTRRRVVLLRLSKGELGTEATTLLGALLVGALWRATMARAAVPDGRRHPVFAYVDEFHNLVRLGDDLSDQLAEARGYGLGFILSDQQTGAWPKATRAAVLGTVRSQVLFQVERDDAQLLASRFEPLLSAADLTGLGKYEIAARLCVDGRTQSPVTGRTLPLGERLRDPAALRAELAARHGMPRSEVEAAMARRLAVAPVPKVFGERPTEEGRTRESRY